MEDSAGMLRQLGLSLSTWPQASPLCPATPGGPQQDRRTSYMTPELQKETARILMA